MPKDTIPIKLSGGVINRHTPLDMYLRGQGECETFVNVDTSIVGKLGILRPLASLNASAESSAIHSVFRALTRILVGTGEYLKYLATPNNVLTQLLSGLAGTVISFARAGNWVFLCNGTDKYAVYLTTPVATDWGHAIPQYAPNAVAGAAGNPNGTYQCYYRYKITLPDGTIIRTGLSPVKSVSVTNQKIEWSNIGHATFLGATTLEAELFRTQTGWSGIFLVDTVTDPTSTYSDDKTDAFLQANTAFAETDYYPPPSNPDFVVYHPGADRLFVALDNDVYWSEAGLYHIFKYNSDADEYENVNSVFLSGENLKVMILLDDQLYFASEAGWRRLRGKNPSYWSWEDTAAIKGPVSNKATMLTPWGILYPANDSFLWLFNGYDARRLIESYKLRTKPDSTCHASWDGRFYRLFYNDATYPHVIVDFYGYPSTRPRIIESDQDMECSHYDKASNELYYGDANGYLRNGDDTTTEVSLTIKTGEMPVEDLAHLGDMGILALRLTTGGDSLTITPYQDGTAKTALQTFSASSLQFLERSLTLGSYYVLALQFQITTNKAIEIYDPIILRKDN